MLNKQIKNKKRLKYKNLNLNIKLNPLNKI